MGKSLKSDPRGVASLKVISPDEEPVDRRVSVDCVEAVAERLRTLAPGQGLEIPMPTRKRAEDLQARLRYAGFKSVVRDGRRNEEACLYAYALWPDRSSAPSRPGIVRTPATVCAS